MSDPQASPQVSKRRKLLQNDEWVALIVAFGTIGGVMAYSLMRDRPGGMSSLMSLGDRTQVSVSVAVSGANSANNSGANSVNNSGNTDSDNTNASAGDDQSVTQRVATKTNTTVKGVGVLLGSGLAASDPSRSQAGEADSLETSHNASTSANQTSSGSKTGEGAESADTAKASTAATSGEAGLPDVAAGSASVATDLEVTSTPVEFSDVADDRWSKPFIDELSKRKLISGFPDGTFAPDRPVTRAELAAQVQQIFERDDRLRDLIAFSDVDDDYWGRAAIDKSVEIGFLNGYPNAIFSPDKSVSRLEVAIALATGLGLNPSDSPEAVLTIFPDAETVPDWAKPKMAASTQAGFTVVDPELQQLDPSAAATREVVAVMMYQALVWAGQAEPIESDRLVRP